MSISRKEFIADLGIGVLAASLPAALRAGTAYGSARPGDERYWASVRSQFPVVRTLGYFNTGGLGPAPASVMEVFCRAAALHQERCDTGHDSFEDARAAAASFFGVAADEVCFTRNTTEGNCIVAAGLMLGEGDEVILDSHAHPGGSFPWYSQLRTRGVAVRLFEPSAASASENVNRIEALITPRTKAIQISHVTAPTGILMPAGPIAKLARRHGAWFHVDGAQSAGMVAFSVAELGCDSFATSGHKWLGAPHETGLLVVRAGSLERLVPVEVGAYSGELPFLPGILKYAPGARRFEYGTRSAAAVAGVAAALDWHRRIGRKVIQARGLELADRLREGLASTEGIAILSPQAEGLRSSILTFRSSRMGYQALFSRLLSKHRMRCRPVSEQGLDALRVSAHVFNSPEECDRLVAAVRECQAAG